MIGHEPEDHDEALSIIDLRVIHELFWARHPHLYYLMDPNATKSVRKCHKKSEVTSSLFRN